MHVTPHRGAGRSAARRLRTAIAGLVLLLALPGGAAAHADLVASTPRPNEVLATVPADAVLTFSEALQDGSRFAVLDDTGATVATGAPDPADATVMRGALPALTPGVYEVQWTSVAADGDVERDTYTFSVAVPSPPPSTLTAPPTDTPTGAPTEAPAATDAPTAMPIGTPEPTAEGGTGSASGGDALFPILAVLVLVGAGVTLVVRRRGPA